MFYLIFQAAEGTGLAFIVFTQAIVELPGAPFWSVIFFMMLLSLGIGSQIGILEGMLCTIFDIEIFKRIKKQYLTGEWFCYEKKKITDVNVNKDVTLLIVLFSESRTDVASIVQYGCFEW